MKSQIEAKQFSQIPIPNHSVDWRFLLPIDENTKILVIRDAHIDYELSLRELGIPVEFITPDQISRVSGKFDMVAAPLGFTVGNHKLGRVEWVNDYKKILHLIRPHGLLLCGFTNFWRANRGKSQIARSSSIWEMRRIFGELNLQSHRFFGVLSEPLTPEYIFPLSAQSLNFVLNHRFQHKIPKAVLMSSRTPAARFLLHLLPFYYVIVQASAK